MMLRNEADLLAAIINHAAELFDSIAIVDVGSTDGTFEMLGKIARQDDRFRIYTCRTQERYQAAMMNRLARQARDDGADWVFFLDGDEFLNVDGRAELLSYLGAFSGDVMHMPWINLIPTRYGTFESFDLAQDFHWSGRVAPFRKVAISIQYMAVYPDFEIEEGNHNVAPARGARPELENLGLGLLHLPVRSVARLKYKLANGIRLLASKHNTFSGEGNHAQRILDAIAQGGSQAGVLNDIAGRYGSNDDTPVELDPIALDWPRRTLPAFLREGPSVGGGGKTFIETVAADEAQEWEKASFVSGSPISAQLLDGEVLIAAQPVRGSGVPVRGRFRRQSGPNTQIATEVDFKLLAELANASLVKIDVLRFSAWSKLIPLLFSLFALARPRRFVELGVHNGMSFFAACQIAEHLKIKTECVGIDSWVGDPHASFHSNEVFDTFRATIAERYPDQAYVQAMFRDALGCFEDGSIDLLHIDGYHTYDAVKDDFDTWLPKMSQDGLVIFHDINVHERGFGVWRFWEELKARYPGYGFMHSHGLGVLYVGEQETAISKMMAILQDNLDARIFVQQYFEVLGEISIENREAAEGIADQSRILAEKDNKIREFQGYLDHRDSIIATLQSGTSAKAGEAAEGIADQSRILAEKDNKIREFQGYLDHRDSIIATLQSGTSAKAGGAAASGALLVNDPALAAAREANRRPEGKGLIGRLRAQAERKRWNRNIQAMCEAIQASGMFDAAFYLQQYPDIRESSVDPLHHYVEHGAFELRDPSPRFSSGGYLQRNRDVLTSGLNPLFHYVEHGKNEGRMW